MSIVHRIVVVDPSGNVVPGNIVPFEISPPDAITDPPTNTDGRKGSTDFNGHVCGFANGTNLTYYFEYSTNCSLDTNVTRTPSHNIMATGTCDQAVPPQTVSGLTPGAYCYRYVFVVGWVCL